MRYGISGICKTPLNCVTMVLCLRPHRDHKKWSRGNGWSFPLHPFQLLAWLFLVMFGLLYFGVLVPSLPSGTWQITAYVVNGLIFLFHIIIHLISVSLNPADPNVRAKNYKGPLPYFDRKKHAHVIENQFCYICEVKVGIKSKHCSACNKCISDFDHHCKWLNNCIGKRNYRLFLGCVASALLGCLLILVASSFLIAAYFMKDSWLYVPEELRVLENSTLSASFSTVSSLTTASYPLSSTLPLVTPSTNITYTGTLFFVFIPVTGVLWLVVVVLTAALSLLAVSLLSHLLFFHICLIAQGLSTYEYIVQKRNENSSDSTTAKQNGNAFHEPKANCWNHCLKQILHKKANQVSPAKRCSNIVRSEAIELSSSSSAQQISVAVPNVAAANQTVQSSNGATLENIAGNVYLGSPQRRRRYLEPLYLWPNRATDPQQRSISPLGSEIMQDCIGINATTGKTPESEQPHSGGNFPAATLTGYVRRRHNSTSPTLPPIMEVDGAWCKKEVPPLQRSVSSQSLRSEEGDVPTDDIWNKGLGEKTNSSLSNLLLGVEADAVEEVGEETLERSRSLLSFPILNTRERTPPVPRMSRCLSLNEMVSLHPKSATSGRNVVQLAGVATTALPCNIIESSSCDNPGSPRVYHKGKSFAAVQEITTIPVFDSVVMEYHSTYRQSPLV